MTTTSLEPDSTTGGQVIPLAARARPSLPTPRQVQATVDALCPAMARGEAVALEQARLCILGWGRTLDQIPEPPSWRDDEERHDAHVMDGMDALLAAAAQAPATDLAAVLAKARVLVWWYDAQAGESERGGWRAAMARSLAEALAGLDGAALAVGGGAA